MRRDDDDEVMRHPRDKNINDRVASGKYASKSARIDSHNTAVVVAC